MVSSKLARWGGGAAIVAGLLAGITMMVIQVYGDPPSNRLALYTYELCWGGTAVFMAVYAIAIGRIHRQNGRDFGRPGKIALFLLGLTGVLFGVKTLIVLGGLLSGVVIPFPFIIMPLFMLPGSVGALVGPILLGIAILRSGVMPRWFGWLQVLLVPLTLAANVAHDGGLAQAAILLILGLAVLAGWTIPAAQSGASVA